MSVRKAREFYQSLTPQQKHFVDNKTINTTLSIKHWIAFLSKTSDYDLYGDTARSIIKWRVGFLIAGTIVTTIVAISTEWYYLFLLIMLFVFFIYQSVQTGKEFVQRDINNYLRLFFMPFLEAMKKKAGEEAKLSASLDFRDPFKALTPVESKIKVAGRTRNVATYEPKMIIAGVKLADQSNMEMVLLDEIDKITWRNVNNKSRSKTKTLHRLFIRLTVDKNTYRLKSATLPPDVEFSEDDHHLVFKLKHKEKQLGEDILKPSVFFGALASLYNLIDAGAGTVPPVAGAPLQTTQGVPAPGLVETLMWNDLIFNEYDHDSVMRRNRGIADDGDGAGDESGKVFDS